MSTPAYEIASALSNGKPEPNGSGYSCRCPVHGDKHNSLSVKDDGKGGIVVNCFTGCNYKEIKDELRRMGLLPEWKPGENSSTYTPLKAKPASKPLPEKGEKVSYPWKMADSDHNGDIKKYFANRSLHVDPLPLCFRWGSYKDKQSGDTVRMIVAAASKPDDKNVYAVQRLFIDKEDYTKTGAKMHGNCASHGRGVWIDRKNDLDTILVGEGIETVLSARQVTGKNGVAALSTAGMKNLIFPNETGVIYILVDSDPVRKKVAASMPGQKAAYLLAEKFTQKRESNRAFLVTPDDTCFTDHPAKLDFNDLLKNNPSGDTLILERFAHAVEIKDLEWRPPGGDNDYQEEKKKPRTPDSILEKYAVKTEYVDNLGNEEFLYDDLLIKNHILVIIAESGGGKTTFLFFNVCKEMARKGLRVHYFDADSPPSDHKRMKEFADKHGIGFRIPDVNQGTSVASLITDLEEMAESQADLKDFVFIFDTLKKFIDLMSKQSAKDFFVLMRRLTKLGASVILPGHAVIPPKKYCIHK